MKLRLSARRSAELEPPARAGAEGGWVSPREIVDMLRPGNFEPCVFITNSGHRYEVRHAELAVVTPNGTVRIYRPTTSDAGEVEPFVRVGARNIAAIEPLSIGAG